MQDDVSVDIVPMPNKHYLGLVPTPARETYIWQHLPAGQNVQRTFNSSEYSVLLLVTAFHRSPHFTQPCLFSLFGQLPLSLFILEKTKNMHSILNKGFYTTPRLARSWGNWSQGYVKVWHLFG